SFFQAGGDARIGGRYLDRNLQLWGIKEYLERGHGRAKSGCQRSVAQWVQARQFSAADGRHQSVCAVSGLRFCGDRASSVAARHSRHGYGLDGRECSCSAAEGAFLAPANYCCGCPIIILLRGLTCSPVTSVTECAKVTNIPNIRKIIISP